MFSTIVTHNPGNYLKKKKTRNNNDVAFSTNVNKITFLGIVSN